MSKKKQQPQPRLTPERYIREKARKLPMGDCFLSNDIANTGEALAVVTRLHAGGTYTIGTYLVDAYCMGVKQSIYKFNIDKIDYERIVKRRILKKVPYPEIHNLVYGAVEFAREAHAMQAKNFTAVTQYILEEDTDDIPYIEYEFGKDGKHFFCADDRIALNAIVPKLCENLGADNVLWAQKLTDTPKLGSEFKFIPPAEKEEKKEETEIPEKWRIPRISLW